MALKENYTVYMFTKRITIPAGGDRTLTLVNTLDYDSWGGNFEVKLGWYKPTVGPYVVRTLWGGGPFIITGGTFSEFWYDARRESPTAGDDVAINLLVNADTKSLDVKIINIDIGAACIMVCNFEMFTTYGTPVKLIG